MAFFDRFGLNPREQRAATIFAGVFGVMAVLALPVGVSSLVSGRRAENEELKSTLEKVQGARADIRDRQSKRDAIVYRYQKKAPALGGFLEQSARSVKLDVADSVDRPEVPIGKRYVERATVIHLKKSSMLPIARFMEAIEKSQYAVAISRLNVRKRSGEPDSFDVELGVTAYDRNETAPAAADSKEKKP
jgi:general secretion pathway protein M